MSVAEQLRSRTASREVRIRPLEANDLEEADRIFRLAFGTFAGLPDPMTFCNDADYVRQRWHAAPSYTFAAQWGEKLVGFNFAVRWGSIAYFGPLGILPDFWDRGLGSRLMEPVMALFHDWQSKQTGLFTWPNSPKHLHFYQKFGYWPRFLTSIMSKPAKRPERECHSLRYSEVQEHQRPQLLADCRGLTDQIYPGLDLTSEIVAVERQRLGETLLVAGEEEGRVAAMAICHIGPHSEAGSGTCYVKFGAARPGATAPDRLSRLLEACESLSVDRGMSRLVIGMNTARHEAYRQALDYGFRTEWLGIVMQRPNEPGYNRPGMYVIDDWR
jgi:GNAT superfamily N-acetyltransferase